MFETETTTLVGAVGWQVAETDFSNGRGKKLKHKHHKTALTADARALANRSYISSRPSASRCAPTNSRIVVKYCSLNTVAGSRQTR